MRARAPRAAWHWLVVLGSLSAVIVACQTVPITGRSQLVLLSEGDEVRMGIQAYRQIVGKAKVSADPALNEMVGRVGRRIAAATGRAELPWEFTVIDENQANAFALPGGKVAVYTGILPITRDEAGLAAVLAHEVSHVIARHSGERVSQQLALQLGAEIAGGALRVDARTLEIGSALLIQGLLLPWGRQQESEADHLGLIYMAKAGYDPRAARELWLRMQDAAKGRSRPPEFLSTHPSEETRIRQIEAWLPEALQHYRRAD